MIVELLAALQLGGVFTGIALILKAGLDGYARVRRVEYEGQAKLLRAERGDAEPPVVLNIRHGK
jgi:hypothetical protein